MAAPTGGTPAKPVLSMQQRVQARAAKDPAFLAHAQANPGLRAMLSFKMLTPAQRAARTGNQPVTPGSTLTNRGLASQAKNAVAVQYGPADTQASQLQQNVPAYFRNYLADLQAHQAATKAANDAAVQQDQQLLAGVRPLDQANSAQMQSAANQDAANRGTTAGDTTQTASDASQVRQAMLAALGSAQAGRGAAANTYASTLANVVGPGQQLGAQQAAGEKLLGIRQQEGAANQQYRSDTIASEAKNVLAQQIAGTNAQAKAGTLKLGAARVAATVQHNKATEANQAAAAAQRTQAAADRKTAADAKPNQYGIPTGQFNSWSTAHRQRVIDEFKASGGAKTKKPASGPGSIGAPAEAKTIALIHRVAGVVSGAVGTHVKNKDGSTTIVTHDLLRKALTSGKNPLGQPIDPRIVGIAYDIAAGKPLSPHSVQLAHDLGIHVGKHFKVAPRVSVKAPKPAAGAAPAITNPLGPIG